MPKSATESLLDEITNHTLDSVADTAAGTDPDDDSELYNQPGDEPEDDPADDEVDTEEEDTPDPEDELAEDAADAEEGDDEEEEEPPAGKQRAEAVKAVTMFDPRAKFQTDKKGNIYLDGKKVVNAGREATIFKGMRNLFLSEQKAAIDANKRVLSISSAAQELARRYDSLSQQKGMFDNSGLSPEEQAQMLQLAIAYKKSPLDGLKLMLTQAHMAGVDIKSLGAPGAIDPAAIMSSMEGRLKELLKPVLDQTSEQSAQTAFRTEAEGFFERNPAALEIAPALGGAHKLGQILVQAKRGSPNLSLDELWQRLHYAILQRTGGRGLTAPVTRQGRPNRMVRKAAQKNFGRSVRKASGIESVEDIANSVLRDARAADARGV